MRRRATTNLDDIRRSLRLGMGPCQGGFCIPRATGILHGIDGMGADEANASLLRLPAGALEGHLADPLRRPAPPGAAGRLDLPGRARRGAPAGDEDQRGSPAPTSTWWSSVGARPASRRARAWPRAVRASSSWPRASGRPTSRRARSTCSATRPSRVEAPADALPAFAAAHPEHPYAVLGPDAVAPALDWFRACVEAGPQPGYRLRRRPDAQPPAADGRRCPATLGARPGDDGGGRRRRRHEPGLRRRDARPARLLRQALRGQPRGGRDPRSRRRARGRRRARRRERARPRAAPGRPVVPARPSPASSARSCAAASASRCPRCSGCATRMASGQSSRSASAGRCSRSRRSRRRCPACASPTCCAARCARPAGGSCSVRRSSTRERDGARMTAVRARASGHDVTYHARWFVLATGGLNRARSSSARTGSSARPRSGSPCTARRSPGEPRFLPDVLRRAADVARRRGGRRRRCAPRAPRTSSSPARRCRAPCRGRKGPARASRLASAFRAAATVLSAERIEATA